MAENGYFRATLPVARRKRRRPERGLGPWVGRAAARGSKRTYRAADGTDGARNGGLRSETGPSGRRFGDDCDGRQNPPKLHRDSTIAAVDWEILMVAWGDARPDGRHGDRIAGPALGPSVGLPAGRSGELGSRPGARLTRRPIDSGRNILRSGW
jgi:hypothetical protein